MAGVAIERAVNVGLSRHDIARWHHVFGRLV